jgi:hypothetical protein
MSTVTNRWACLCCRTAWCGEEPKTLQHFQFDSASPGMVMYHQKLADPELSMPLAIDPERVRQELVGLPPVIHPPGLSAERQQYLRQHIRPFVRSRVQDVVCP